MRDARQIKDEIVARLLAATDITDIRPGSVADQIVGAIAAVLEQAYLDIETLKDLYYFDRLHAEELDARAADILPDGMERQEASRSQSPAVVVVRKEAGNALDIQDGMVLIEYQGHQYQNTTTVHFDAGETKSGPVGFIALEPGSNGNLPAGTTFKVVSPEGMREAYCNMPFTGGTDRESDEAFRARIREYARGLHTATVYALQNAIRNQEFASGRVRFARLVESSGGVTIWIDDGSGNLDMTRSATDEEKTICEPCGTTNFLWLPVWPIKEDGGFTVYADSTAYAIENLGWEPQWGRIELPGNETISKAYVDGGLSIYLGLVAEVQKAVEAVRPAGIPVRVLPAQRRGVSIKVHVLYEQGTDVPGTATKIEQATTDYVNNLDIGEPLYLSSLIAVARMDGVETVRSVLVNDNQQDIRPAMNEVVRIDSVEVI